MEEHHVSVSRPAELCFLRPPTFIGCFKTDRSVNESNAGGERQAINSACVCVRSSYSVTHKLDVKLNGNFHLCSSCSI